jgi:hypothetical protein
VSAFPLDIFDVSQIVERDLPPAIMLECIPCDTPGDEAMKSFYRGAQTAATFARLINAAFHGKLAILFIGFASWLALPFGQGWVLDVLAILFGLQGAAIGVKGLEIFLSTRPPDRPDERERYLQSRSLYNPGSRREAGRRERES